MNTWILVLTMFTVAPDTLTTKTDVQQIEQQSYQTCKMRGAAELKKLEGSDHVGGFFTCRRK